MTVTETHVSFVVLGDLHGDLEWARRAVRATAEAGITRIFQVGDAGFCWPGRDKYKFDRKLDRTLMEHGVELVFIDGNHDAHPELRRLPLDDSGLAPLRDHIFYLPRGARIHYAGLDLGALGGAYSLDHQWRTQGKDWWPEEEVHPSDVDRLIAKGQVDVLLTHDVPIRVQGLHSQFSLSEATARRANLSRELLQEAIDALKPRQVFCGHWHQRRTFELHHNESALCTRVDVLDMNGSREGNGVQVLALPGQRMLIAPLHI